MPGEALHKIGLHFDLIGASILPKGRRRITADNCEEGVSPNPVYKGFNLAKRPVGLFLYLVFRIENEIDHFF